MGKSIRYKFNANIYICSYSRNYLHVNSLHTQRLVYRFLMNEQVSTQKLIDPKTQALQKTLDIISGKWRLYIIYQLGTQSRRYGELRRMIPEVSEKVLIQELKVLVSLGVIEKKSFHEVPPRVEYKLTEKGLEVLPALIKLTSIGEMFLEP